MSIVKWIKGLFGSTNTEAEQTYMAEEVYKVEPKVISVIPESTKTLSAKPRVIKVKPEVILPVETTEPIKKARTVKPKVQVSEFTYPMWFKSLSGGYIVKFTSLNDGEVIDGGEGPHLTSFFSHTDSTLWKQVKEPKAKVTKPKAPKTVEVNSNTKPVKTTKAKTTKYEATIKDTTPSKVEKVVKKASKEIKDGAKVVNKVAKSWYNNGVENRLLANTEIADGFFYKGKIKIPKVVK